LRRPAPAVNAPPPPPPQAQPVPPPQLQAPPPLFQGPPMPPVVLHSQQLALPSPPSASSSSPAPAPQVQQNPAPARQPLNPRELMFVLETKVLMGGAIAGMQKLAFCVEDVISRVYSVDFNGHSEDHAVPEIV